MSYFAAQPTRTVETGLGPFAIAVVLGRPRAIAFLMLGGIGLVVCPLIFASGMVWAPLAGNVTGGLTGL
jgi:hypothetical protein